MKIQVNLVYFVAAFTGQITSFVYQRLYLYYKYIIYVEYMEYIL